MQCASCGRTRGKDDRFCGGCGRVVTPAQEKRVVLFDRLTEGFRFDECEGADATGRFHLYPGRRHGSGARDAVGVCLAPELEQPVASTLGRAFAKAATVLSSLASPALPLVLAAQGAEAGSLLVLERARGTSLRRLLARSDRLSVASAGWVALQLGGLLEALHNRGLVLRELSLERVELVLRPGGELAVRWQGVPVFCPLGESGTRAWALPPELYAVSPEQGEHAPLDARSDVYNLALVLYELLFGRPVFHASTGRVWREAQRAGLPTFELPGLPAAPRDALRRALSLDSEQRQRSVALLLRELDLPLSLPRLVDEAQLR